ncbi:hypothetical protein [Salinibacter sp.]|uniref:hypothetical protein n=1 Tax=Salinibacter sp. TaxID=2065818 RepID=UPI0021E82BFF|nr:hypothetical protein [Salinibacter sp.]
MEPRQKKIVRLESSESFTELVRVFRNVPSPPQAECTPEGILVSADTEVSFLNRREPFGIVAASGRVVESGVSGTDIDCTAEPFSEEQTAPADGRIPPTKNGLSIRIYASLIESVHASETALCRLSLKRVSAC